MNDRDALIERVRRLADHLGGDADLLALISLASPSPAQTETLECVNCGSREGIDAIRARGQISCCPERNMKPSPSPAQWPEDVVERAARAILRAQGVDPDETVCGVPGGEPITRMMAVGFGEARAALATLPPPEDERVKGLVSALEKIAEDFEDYPGPEHKHLGDQPWFHMSVEQRDMARSALASYRGGA